MTNVHKPWQQNRRTKAIVVGMQVDFYSFTGNMAVAGKDGTEILQGMRSSGIVGIKSKVECEIALYVYDETTNKTS